MRETTIHIALADHIEDDVTGSETPGWLRRLIAIWLTLSLSERPDDFGIRHSVAQTLAMPAGADSHGR